MTKEKNELVERIGDDAVKLDWEVAFGGKSKGNRHLYRVNEIAKYLLEKEDGDEFIVLVGAWIHDVALASGSDYDSERVENYTRDFLQKYSEIPNEIKEKIIDCAVGHESNGMKLSTEAAIVHDADAVDKCGALGVVRHIWKMTNMLENRVLTSKADLEKLKKHLRERQTNLLTDTANKLVADLNKQGNLFFSDEVKALKMMKRVSSLAFKGMTTDKIIKEITKPEEQADLWKNVLNEQLECKYLK